MTRRAVLLGFMGLSASPRLQADGGFHLRGRVTATEQEAQEGYFTVGRDFTMVTRPESPLHGPLRQLIDREVEISVVVP